LNKKPAGKGRGVAGSSRQHQYNPEEPKATYEVPKLTPYQITAKVVFDDPDPHVELQERGWSWSFLADWLMGLQLEPVKFPPKKPQWMSCFEVSMGHRGELKK
jgi:hypothetical protein